VRWTRTLGFTPGTYRFYSSTDDGVRIYVDGHADHHHSEHKSMKTIIILVITGIFTIPHEICHFLVGRLLGVRTEIINISHTMAYDYHHIPAWKMVAIDLAPTLFGIGLALALGGHVLEMPRPRAGIGLVGAWYVSIFLSSCLGDWRDAWHDRSHPRHHG
jgi:hypothetical protein